MKKEKVMICITGLGCGVALIVLCFSLGILGKKRNSEVFFEISAKEVMEALKEEKDMIIYCGQDTCSACRSFSPILEKISNEENKKIYYLDVDLIVNQRELEKYQIQETPTLININNGKVYIYRGTMNEGEIRKAISDDDIEKVQLEGINSIIDDSLEKMKTQPKDFILYIGREDCGDCQKFEPILEEYLSDNASGVYYLSLKEYREKANRENATEEDVKKYEEIKEKYDIAWVPTLIHIRNGIQVSRFEFLDEGYGELEEKKKKEYEQEYIIKFYEWIDREIKY